MVWLLLPLAPLILWSIAARWAAPALLPQTYGFAGWQGVWASGAAPALARSAGIGIVVSCVATVVGAAAGRALAWRAGRGTSAAALVLLLPVLVPPFTIAMGLEVQVLRLRIPPVVALAVVLVVLALPYTAYIMRAAYAALDPDLEHQARTLGATRRAAFYTVTVPALRPALVASAGVAFLVGWSDYIVTVVVGGGTVVTLPMLLASALSGSGNEQQAAALALLAVVPILVIGAISLVLRHTGRDADST